ncbi:Cyclic nucleotide-gated cation channel alpha-3 [Phytophthora citrophthora]|uniref:Cyclic nucleotide-gated cation channel alpha-3 n=1 Tax=Phytophthora citrophthora TaxID=4793 RepID=A0AAD9LIY7_9STRA|nr:Cyclic nucleotide-gated cation channel alpha-3 [Phytophthora citrophthora]
MPNSGSKGSKGSEKHSWKILSFSRGRSVGRVHNNFSLHTRLADVLADDRQDAVDPNATMVKVWEQVVLLCVLHESFMLPYVLAFQPEAMEKVSELFILVVVCEGVFAVDLYVQAHMGYYSDGNLIRDKRRTIEKYVRSRRFVLDIVALLPSQVLVVWHPHLVNKLLFLKFLRWTRLPHLISTLDEFYATHFVVLKLLKVLTSTVYLAHVLACVRYSFGDDDSDSNNWLRSRHSSSLSTDYLASLFWSVGIMTGFYEGQLPRHGAEFMFTILVALCGFSMFTTLCATIFVISKCESDNAEAMGARINQLVHVLSFHRVPEKQQAQAIEYLQRFYTDAESTDRQAATLLCPSIANDIQVELLKWTIAQISLFKGCSDQFIVAMTSLLEMISVPAQTTLFSAGDFGDAMYVVHTGVLAIVVNFVTVREIRKGSCFGEISVFSSMPRTATVVSSTYAILYKLSRFHCERVLQGYPACASLIATHVDDILDQLNNAENDAGANILPSSTVDHPEYQKKALLRSPSIAAGAVAGASALARVLTRKGNDVFSAPRRRMSRRLSRKTAVSPGSLRFSQKSQKSQQSSKSNHSGQRLETGCSTTSEDFFVSSAWRLNSDQVIRKRTPSLDSPNQSRNAVIVYRHYGLWGYFLFRRCIDHHSRARMWWLLLLFSNLCYCWVMIPVQVIFPLWQRPSWITLLADGISNFGLLLDIVLNFNLSFTAHSEKIMNPMRSAQRYLRDGFVFDVVCALPCEYAHMSSYGLMRLPRLVRVYHVRKNLEELGQFIPLNGKRHLFLLGMLLFMMAHVIACTYFGISYFEGFDPNEHEAWICPSSLCLRGLNATHLENCNGKVFSVQVDGDDLQAITVLEYFRSLYFAVGVFASPGSNIEPTSDVQYVAALVFMLGGFLVSAVVVDNVQKRLTASAFEHKEFFEASSRIQLFLRRQKVPSTIHHRVKSFLDYWWSSHRGSVISELLADLPRHIRLKLLRSICKPVLQMLAGLECTHQVRDNLEEVLVENAQFVLYGQGETVYRHGDYVAGLFFLLEGEASMVQISGPPSEICRGSFFGIAALMQQERGEGYTEHVSANSGCVLLFISRDQLQAMEVIFPPLKEELRALEYRLHRDKLASIMSTDTDQDAPIEVKTKARVLHVIITRLQAYFTTVYDPDSTFVLVWEAWVFGVVTIQWVLVMFEACFPLTKDEHRAADCVMIFLEVSFVLDMCIRSRLGFYEYGNKTMDFQRIRRQYFNSRVFALDIVALIPLYFVNWSLPSTDRWDLVNLNKLLRILKVPGQLQALETRYLKRTTELRILKLLYYTFMLSHILGCIWFSFASKAAAPSFSDDKSTAFGENLWLPSKELENGSRILQYMASLYWSFGLMSSSGSSDTPSTTWESLFSVITMTLGIFLFAYVIGNFTDIIELTSSETREFNAKMSAVCQMLDHFRMPGSLQKRVKTFLLFKRFHTITQERILVHCLPPSLLTDIRLVFLKPMIEKVDFLADMERSITRMLVSQFTQVLVSRGEFVCKYGDKGSDMFFVFTGVLNVLLPLRVASRITLKKVAEAVAGKKSLEQNESTSRDGPRMDDIINMVVNGQRNSVQHQPKKVNEISAGGYFGENGLFTDGQRNVYIQAQTSCILYRLSRESLELVFDRYPAWKEKVLQVASIHQEQARLQQLSRAVQRRGVSASPGLVASRSDIINERAESIKERRNNARGNNSQGSFIWLDVMRWLKRHVVDPLLKLLGGLIHGAAVQSELHHFWLRLMIASTVFVAIMIPYQLVMDTMNRTTVTASVAKVLELLSEVAFVVDLWFSWHIQDCTASMELYDEKLRSIYKKERILWDVIAAIPFYDLVAIFINCKWLKLLRCVKIFNVVNYLDELNRRSVTNDTKRFWHVCFLYLLTIYWTACAYLAVSMEIGFAALWNSWLPSQELEVLDSDNPSSSKLFLRFLRGLFFATTMFVKKGYTPEPDTASLYTFHIAISFIGLIVMSFVIGELASLFISYIGLEVEFRKNYIAVELYLSRLRVSDRIRARTDAFMTSLWSSHAGVNYEDLLEELPQEIRAACVLHVSKKPLEWFVMKVITPVCWEGEEVIDTLTLSLAEHLRFESYPRDENVVTEGSIVRAMYFVIKGHLTMRSRSITHRPLGLRDGSYFGERGLLGCTISAYTIRTSRACDLLSLSSEVFAQVLQKYSFTRLALKLCDRAYRHLKEQYIATCARNEMEGHWGKALFHTLGKIKRSHVATEEKDSLKPDQVTATNATTPDEVTRSSDGNITTVLSFATAKKAVDSDGITTAPNEKVVETSTEKIHKDAPFCGVPSNLSDKLDELPVHIDEMFMALNTPRACFEAFAPLLNILLPTDPLDWKASFWECIPKPVNRSDTSGSLKPTTKSAQQNHDAPQEPPPERTDTTGSLQTTDSSKKIV